MIAVVCRQLVAIAPDNNNNDNNRTEGRKEKKKKKYNKRKKKEKKKRRIQLMISLYVGKHFIVYLESENNQLSSSSYKALGKYKAQSPGGRKKVKNRKEKLEESKLMVKHVSLNYLSQRREQTIPRMSTLPSAKS
jgi:hypothetical protein